MELVLLRLRVGLDRERTLLSTLEFNEISLSKYLSGLDLGEYKNLPLNITNVECYQIYYQDLKTIFFYFFTVLKQIFIWILPNLDMHYFYSPSLK